MAPEVVKNQPYNEKVDIYSFGLIMWQVATGFTPFKDFNRADLQNRVVNNGERPLTNAPQSKTNHLSPEIVTLIKHCWEPDFRNRCAASEIFEQF